MSGKVNNTGKTPVRLRLWPSTLLGQMILWVVLALLLSTAVSVWVLSKAHQNRLMLANEHFLVRQFSSLVLLLERTPSQLHENVVKAWRRPGREYGFSEVAVVGPADSKPERRMVHELVELVGSEYIGRIYVDLKGAERKWSGHLENERHAREPHENARLEQKISWRGTPKKAFDHLVLTVQLSDGRWFYSQLSSPRISPLAAIHTVTFLLIACVLVILVVFWQMRRITRPLRLLELAASDLGRGRDVAPLPLSGPRDIQHTVMAFNDMNERIKRFVSDRTRMLASLSHDLRTPMTSMRLRLELMPDSEEREKLIQSLNEMQQMSESSLAFVRQCEDQEPSQSVDLMALVSSLCEDLVELGASVSCSSENYVTLRCRPVSLKRALRNVIENAVRYGERAEVSLEREAGYAVIRVVDAGPGIPEQELESVFDPFYRVDASRNRDTGGVGLGLSIARQIISSHGGDICLHNREKGLEVIITLPLQ